MDVSSFTKNCESNVLIESQIPDICKEVPCILGVDEAGRGPVLGPMVYGIAYCPIDRNSDLNELGVDDSKALTETQREDMLAKIFENKDWIGWMVHVLSPVWISNGMYRRCKYNLNSMSHDTAIGLIRRALDFGIRVTEVYLDTVGPPDKYQAKLKGIFPELKITVSKKADSIYPCVSAASICAKVARDHCIKNWDFGSLQIKESSEDNKWGSGYPNDPATKKFLQKNLHPIFGFPSIVRFSWKTAEKLLEDKAIRLEFEEEEPEEDERMSKNPSVKNYFVTQPSKAEIKRESSNSRHTFFKDRNLSSATFI